MSDAAIRVENLGKRYRIGALQPSYHTLRDALVDLATSPFQRLRNGSAEATTFWALRDVSFEVNRGEVLGVIGRNGAGKTTLLKILSRITVPTEGYAEVRGRLASLLEVGTGFHGELTGRENIYLNGAILGMKRAEIDRKFDEIVAFAEVEQFLDTPVKRYSSGMYMRLAFAVAAHLEPEILLVDEVLAVGDAAFQKKCLGKMEEVAQSGRTVLFVSHNMGAVSELCTEALLLDHGRILTAGGTSEVLASYTKLSEARRIHLIEEDGTAPAHITAFQLTNSRAEECGSFDISERIALVITYTVKVPLRDLQIVAALDRNTVRIVHSFNTDEMADLPMHHPGTYRAEYELPAMFLKAGQYTLSLAIGTPDQLMQDLDSVLRFEVTEHSQNTRSRGYAHHRPGHVISPGKWTTIQIA